MNPSLVGQRVEADVAVQVQVARLGRRGRASRGRRRHRRVEGCWRLESQIWFFYTYDTLETAYRVKPLIKWINLSPNMPLQSNFWLVIK